MDKMEEKSFQRGLINSPFSFSSLAPLFQFSWRGSFPVRARQARKDRQTRARTHTHTKVMKRKWKGGGGTSGAVIFGSRDCDGGCVRNEASNFAGQTVTGNQ